MIDNKVSTSWTWDCTATTCLMKHTAEFSIIQCQWQTYANVVWGPDCNCWYDRLHLCTIHDDTVSNCWINLSELKPRYVSSTRTATQDHTKMWQMELQHDTLHMCSFKYSQHVYHVISVAVGLQIVTITSFKIMIVMQHPAYMKLQFKVDYIGLVGTCQCHIIKLCMFTAGSCVAPQLVCSRWSFWQVCVSMVCVSPVTTNLKAMIPIHCEWNTIMNNQNTY